MKFQTKIEELRWRVADIKTISNQITTQGHTIQMNSKQPSEFEDLDVQISMYQECHPKWIEICSPYKWMDT